MSAEPAAEKSAGNSSHRKIFALSAAVVALDFASKQLVVTLIEGKPPVRVIGSLVTFWVGRNPGAAFSMGADGSTLVFTAIAMLAIAALIIWMPRILASVESPLMTYAFAFALAGAAGNLIDRLVRAPGIGHGHVVDFIALPHFPIFNVSDMSITAAATLYVCANIGANRRAAHSAAAEPPPSLSPSEPTPNRPVPRAADE